MTRRTADDFAAEMAARKQGKGATLVALNGLRIEQESDTSNDRLEAIAKEIETLRATALMRIAGRLAEAQGIFRYRRDEGGFGGWVERRLHFSRDKAYDLLHVHEQFGGQSVELFDTLAPTVLYELAKPSTPESAREEALKRAEAGEQLSVAEAKSIVAQHRYDVVDDDDDDAHRHMVSNANQVNKSDRSPAPKPSGSKSRVKRSTRRTILKDWAEGTPEERQAVQDLVLCEYFEAATGADILQRIPAGMRKDVVGAFLDLLTVSGLLAAMSAEFGRELRARVPAPKKASKPYTRSINLTATRSSVSGEHAGDPERS